MNVLKKNSGNIFFGTLLLISVVLYAIEIINITSLIGLLLSFGTIYFGFLKIKIQDDILFKELFERFNERYDKELNDLLNQLRMNPQYKLTEDDKKLIIDYFNLSSEEFLWYKKNRIPNDVWKAWKAGIEENLQIEQVRELFNQETSSKRVRISYYGLYEELKTNN